MALKTRGTAELEGLQLPAWRLVLTLALMGASTTLIGSDSASCGATGPWGRPSRSCGG